jgi:hypothetical protein
MKTDPMKLRPTKTAAWPLALLLLLMSGCLEKHLVWSPDGQRAAVIAKGGTDAEDGLYLCDAEGKLTSRLAPAVYRVAWLGDSQQLVVARTQKVRDWAALAQWLGAERTAAITAKAEAAWNKAEASRPGQWGLDMSAGDGDLIMVYLWAHHAEGLRAQYGAKAEENRSGATVTMHELLMAKLVDDGIQLGTLLHDGLSEIQDIRIAPGDRAVAFTEEATPGSDEESHLLLARINGTRAVLVAERTNAFPDWTADGRSLVYVQALGGGAKKDDLQLGSLVRREVLGEDGKIKAAENPKEFMGFKEKSEDTAELAGLMYSAMTRVRCLHDGRILFNAAELQLPLAEHDAEVERERLFALDLARQATLVRVVPRGYEKAMPKMLTFFEVSPDEKQVLVGGFEGGEVSVLTLATGEVKEVQKVEKEDKSSLLAAPVWRSAGEITYARRNSPDKDGKMPDHKADIVLRKGDAEKILSQGWSDRMIKLVFPGSDK